MIDFLVKEGDTGLIKASVNNHENVVKVLVLAGANVNITIKVSSHTAWLICMLYINLLLLQHIIIITQNIATAFYAACELGHVNVAERLIRAGADIEILSVVR